MSRTRYILKKEMKVKNILELWKNAVPTKKVNLPKNVEKYLGKNQFEIPEIRNPADISFN